MVIPRLGAMFLLIGYGFAISQVGRLLYVTAREGYGSWIVVVAMLFPIGVLGLASALLVLWRKPLGRTLGFPFCILLGIVALMTFFSLPPFGGFLDDYERASLDRGVNVPRYLEEQGVTPQEYVEDQTGEVRAQGSLGAVAVIFVYAATVLRAGSRRRPAPARGAGAPTAG